MVCTSVLALERAADLRRVNSRQPPNECTVLYQQVAADTNQCTCSWMFSFSGTVAALMR